jgi:hypothetical protein
MPRIIFVLFLLVLTGCTGQATRSSSAWSSSDTYLYVEPLTPGFYKLDEFNTTHEGLKQLLESNIAMGVTPEIVIYAPLKKNYAAQAQIAILAEELGLKVYRYRPFGHLEIDSATLLDWADSATN